MWYQEKRAFCIMSTAKETFAKLRWPVAEEENLQKGEDNFFFSF